MAEKQKGIVTLSRNRSSGHYKKEPLCHTQVKRDASDLLEVLLPDKKQKTESSVWGFLNSGVDVRSSGCYLLQSGELQ